MFTNTDPKCGDILRECGLDIGIFANCMYATELLELLQDEEKLSEIVRKLKAFY
jgi:hypothetical protein